jgi:glycosyltransferase involved in cell wall biosynthesis
MSAPRFSIVIPTRNRSDTLLHALRTCLAQSFTDYEIIVSDNCSSDSTREVVENIASSQIRYIHSDVLLAMSDSWEFAVSHATGEYIIVIGDDDGLLLHALRDIDSLIGDLKAKAIRWERVYYNWPDIPAQPVANQIAIPLKWDCKFIESSSFVTDVANSRAGYTFLPMLYNSAIHRDLIEEVRQKAGRVFLGRSPDVASGFAFAYLVQRYPSIGRPMSINGGSGKSNGVAAKIQDSWIRMEFQTLNEQSELKCHPFVPDLLTLSAAYADSFLQANAKLFSRDLSGEINKKQLVMNCLRQSRWMFNDADAKETVLQKLSKSLENDPKLCKWFETEVLGSDAATYMPREYIKRKGIINHMLFLDGDDFGVRNVFEVASLYEKITAHTADPIVFPARLKEARRLKLPILFTKVRRKIN